MNKEGINHKETGKKNTNVSEVNELDPDEMNGRWLLLSMIESGSSEFD